MIKQCFQSCVFMLNFASLEKKLTNECNKYSTKKILNIKLNTIFANKGLV